MGTVETVTLRDADRIEILDLYGRCALAIDEGDDAAWAACFTPNGRFRVGNDVDASGHEALAGFARAHHESPHGRGRHHITTVALEATVTGAAGRAYVLITLGGNVAGFARYDDELARDDGGWRFATRRVSV